MGYVIAPGLNWKEMCWLTRRLGELRLAEISRPRLRPSQSVLRSLSTAWQERGAVMTWTFVTEFRVRKRNIYGNVTACLTRFPRSHERGSLCSCRCWCDHQTGMKRNLLHSLRPSETPMTLSVVCREPRKLVGIAFENTLSCANEGKKFLPWKDEITSWVRSVGRERELF